MLCWVLFVLHCLPTSSLQLSKAPLLLQRSSSLQGYSQALLCYKALLCHKGATTRWDLSLLQAEAVKSFWQGCPAILGSFRALQRLWRCFPTRCYSAAKLDFSTTRLFSTITDPRLFFIVTTEALLCYKALIAATNLFFPLVRFFPVGLLKFSCGVLGHECWYVSALTQHRLWVTSPIQFFKHDP